MATWTAGPVLMGVAGKTDRKSSEGTAVEQNSMCRTMLMRTKDDLQEPVTL